MRTTMTSPRANSIFNTEETRETYRMAEEIMEILSFLADYSLTPITSHNIIKWGYSLGFCRPLVDSERIAAAHPYIKILSEMTDPASVHFINNLEELHEKENGKMYSYRLRPDFYRNKNGHWRHVKGADILAKMPMEY